MSHFSVAVFSRPEQDVDEMLAPFDENLDMPRYIKYTKQQLIEKGRKEIETYKNGLYAEFLSDPEKYKKECANLTHLNYIENEFPKHLTWTDEEIFEDQIKYNEDVDEDGNEWSTYNPKSKWDWYEVGGRWGGLLENKSGNRINHSVVSDIIFPPDFTTYAVLLPDGTWHEPEKMLYFGVSAASEEDEKNWGENYYKNFIEKADPNWILTIVDCHI